MNIGIVGKYVSLHDAYLSVAEALKHGGIANEAEVNITWVDSEEITSEKKESNPEMSDLGLPIPKPKRGRPRKDAAATVTAETTAEVPTASTHVVPTTAEEPASVQETVKAEEAMEVAEMSMDVAKAITADLGNYKGMSLGEIYEVAPKNLIFLVRHSTSDDVQRAAKIICKADPVLSERFEI